MLKKLHYHSKPVPNSFEDAPYLSAPASIFRGYSSSPNVYTHWKPVDSLHSVFQSYFQKEWTEKAPCCSEVCSQFVRQHSACKSQDRNWLKWNLCKKHQKCRMSGTWTFAKVTLQLASITSEKHAVRSRPSSPGGMRNVRGKRPWILCANHEPLSHYKIRYARIMRMQLVFTHFLSAWEEHKVSMCSLKTHLKTYRQCPFQ